MVNLQPKKQSIFGILSLFMFCVFIFFELTIPYGNNYGLNSFGYNKRILKLPDDINYTMFLPKYLWYSILGIVFGFFGSLKMENTKRWAGILGMILNTLASAFVAAYVITVTIKHW